jgi:hypothetical protein
MIGHQWISLSFDRMPGKYLAGVGMDPQIKNFIDYGTAIGKKIKVESEW